MVVASFVLSFATVYLSLGCVVALAFVVAGLDRTMSHGGPISLGSRVIIWPACVLLWPVVLCRWLVRAALATVFEIADLIIAVHGDREPG